MTKAGELYALAEQCEKATGPDRELDAQIIEALGYHRTVEGSFYTGPILRYYGKGAIGEVWRLNKLTVPKFTASLDAAMRLVLEGYDWIIGRTNGGLTIHAEVGGRGGDFQRFGNTPALALCAAALRALASGTLTEGGDAKQAPGESLSGPVANGETPKLHSGGSHG